VGKMQIKMKQKKNFYTHKSLEPVGYEQQTDFQSSLEHSQVPHPLKKEEKQNPQAREPYQKKESCHPLEDFLQKRSDIENQNIPLNLPGYGKKNAAYRGFVFF
jgi:hypothetical protein